MKIRTIENRLFALLFLGILAIGTGLMVLRLGTSTLQTYRESPKRGARALFAAGAVTTRKFHNFESELKNFHLPAVNFIRTAVYHLYTGYLFGTGRIIVPADMPHNIVVRGPENFLYYLNGFAQKPLEENRLFDGVHAIAAQQNAWFLQILIPTKQLNYKTELRNFLDLNCDANYDAFLKYTDRADVNRLDCAKIFRQLTVPRDEIFFRTDHHWTPYAALHAVQATVEKARAAQLPNWNPRTFSVENDFEQKHSRARNMLGFQGIRVGRHWSTLDHKSLCEPNFDSYYTVTLEIPGSAPHCETGDFKHAITHDQYYMGNGAFFDNKDYPSVTLVNDRVPDGNILVVQDSFGRPFSAYLSLFAHRVTALDPRYGTLEHFLERVASEKFDAIIYLRSELTLGLIDSRQHI